jgi:hypothetical protein
MARAYLESQDPKWNDPQYRWSLWSARWEIPAVRTGDERCRERARRRFEEGVFASINPDGSFKPDARGPAVVAGVEAANEGTAPALKLVLRAIEVAKARGEEELKRWKPGDGQVMSDPLYAARDEIFRGLCINPLPNNHEVLEGYLDVSEYGDFIGFALLRANETEGIRCLLDGLEKHQGVGSWQWEVFLVYTGQNAFPNPRIANGSVTAAREWYTLHKDDPAWKRHITRVNSSSRLDRLLESWKTWP